MLLGQVGRFHELQENCPEVVAELRELCELRAAECRCALAKYSADTPATPAFVGNRRLHKAVEQARAQLVCRREEDVLLPAAGCKTEDLLTLYRPASLLPITTKVNSGEILQQSAVLPQPLATLGFSSAAGTTRMIGMSCALTEQGELLYLDHTATGLEAAQPASLGWLRPGVSAMRSLRDAEIRERFPGAHSPGQHAVAGSRRLFGCAINLVNADGLLDADGIQPEAVVPQASKRAMDQTETLLLTWSIQDFGRLRQLIRDWLAAHGADLAEARSNGGNELGGKSAVLRSLAAAAISEGWGRVKQDE